MTTSSTSKWCGISLHLLQARTTHAHKKGVDISFIRSTLRQSRPNKASLKCLSACTYVRTVVHPQNVSSISIKFGMWVEVDEWCMTVCSMTRSKFKINVTNPSKLEIQQFSIFPPPFTMGAGNWPRILKLWHNIYILLGRIFAIWPSFLCPWA